MNVPLCVKIYIFLFVNMEEREVQISSLLILFLLLLSGVICSANAKVQSDENQAKENPWND